ncbi:MAG: hypothetical protein ACLPVO_06300 [Desulfomonilaceae bacterium]
MWWPAKDRIRPKGGVYTTVKLRMDAALYGLVESESERKVRPRKKAAVFPGLRSIFNRRNIRWKWNRVELYRHATIVAFYSFNAICV